MKPAKFLNGGASSAFSATVNQGAAELSSEQSLEVARIAQRTSEIMTSFDAGALRSADKSLRVDAGRFIEAAIAQPDGQRPTDPTLAAKADAGIALMAAGVRGLDVVRTAKVTGP